MKTEIEIFQMTDEELSSYKDELNSKFAQLRKLATKIATEMDALSDQYQIVKEAEKNR